MGLCPHRQAWAPELVEERDSPPVPAREAGSSCGVEAWLWTGWGQPGRGQGLPHSVPSLPLPSVPRRPFPPSPPSTGTFSSGYYFVSSSIISCLVNLYSINK